MFSTVLRLLLSKEWSFIYGVVSSVHAFVSNIGFFSVLHGAQPDYGQFCLISHYSVEVNEDSEACFGWFPDTHSSREVLDLQACEVTSANKKADNVRLKRLFMAVPVTLKPGALNTLEEPRAAVSALYGTSLGFPAQSVDFSIVEDEISEKNSLWELCDLTFKVSCKPFALQVILAVRR